MRTDRTAELRQQAKAEPHLEEMGAASEDVRDAKVLHDDHQGKIDEGNVEFVVILLAHLPGAEELRGRNVDELYGAALHVLEQLVDHLTSLVGGRGAVEIVDQLRHDEIRGDVL